MSGNSWAYWALILLVAISLLSFAQGVDFNSQPLIVAAASLITIPMSIANALATSGPAALLLPLFFLFIVYYLGFLRYLLGNELIYFVLFAASLVVLTHTG